MLALLVLGGRLPPAVFAYAIGTVAAKPVFSVSALSFIGVAGGGVTGGVTGRKR